MIAWPKPNEYGYDTNGFKKKMQNIMVNQLLKQTKQNELKLATWTQLLHQGLRNCNQQILKDMIREGIPDQLRRLVWPALIKGSTPAYQTILAQSHNEKIAKIIDLDLERTFPDNIFFAKNQSCYEGLRRVLNALSTAYPEMGYCQGLNFIVATILLRLPENAAFSQCCYILRDFGHGKILMDLKRVKIDLFVFDRLMEKHFRQLSKWLSGHQIESNQYALIWFITLYCGCLPFQYNLRIIELYMSEGKKILFRVALAILKRKKHQIKSLHSFEEILGYLKNFDEFGQLPASQFVKDMFSISISRKQIETYESLYIPSKD